MPPKPKLYKNKGKSHPKVSAEPSTSTTSVATNSSESPSAPQNITDSTEIQEQFELELCWCIQQLQGVLNSGKLNQKQVQEQTKTLNTLMSNTTPFIKKRQVMRLTFGDYRSKMNEESKKLTRGLNLKISSSSPNTKSKFLKRSLPLTTPENGSDTNTANLSNHTDETEKSFHFSKSSNEFRFNFSAEDNIS